METRLELSAGGYGYLYAAQRVERLYEAGKHNLAVQSVVEALDEFSPELLAGIGVDMHAHNDF